MEDDSYRTISGPAEAVFKDKGSRFLAYAWPVKGEEEIKDHLDVLRKKYYDATHHCYAWRLGPKGERERANDDGEPSGTAGKPILGQMLSKEVTDLLIVVVRYFGGTKLGVPGLINAYREAAREVLDGVGMVEKNVESEFDIRFAYVAMNGVMKVVKDMSPGIRRQAFDNVCEMSMTIRESRAGQLRERLLNVEGVEILDR